MASDSRAAWVAFSAAILASTVTCVSGFLLRYWDGREKRDFEIMAERKEALLDALSVIDLVYSNEPLNETTPLNSKEWDIALARNAFNRMLIYCKQPDKTVEAFRKAVGLYNPGRETPPGIRLGYLVEFRKEVARELGLPELKFVDPNIVWIQSLAGTKEAKAMASQREKK